MKSLRVDGPPVDLHQQLAGVLAVEAANRNRPRVGVDLGHVDAGHHAQQIRNVVRAAAADHFLRDHEHRRRRAADRALLPRDAGHHRVHRRHDDVGLRELVKIHVEDLVVLRAGRWHRVGNWRVGQILRAVLGRGWQSHDTESEHTDAQSARRIGVRSRNLPHETYPPSRGDHLAVSDRDGTTTYCNSSTRRNAGRQGTTAETVCSDWDGSVPIWGVFHERQGVWVGSPRLGITPLECRFRIIRLIFRHG